MKQLARPPCEHYRPNFHYTASGMTTHPPLAPGVMRKVALENAERLFKLPQAPVA